MSKIFSRVCLRCNKKLTTSQFAAFGNGSYTKYDVYCLNCNRDKPGYVSPLNIPTRNLPELQPGEVLRSKNFMITTPGAK